MSNNPLVSIIIPTYNRADLIGETLDSIIAQTYKNWECIVVDDGSSDSTEEVLNFYTTKDSRISYHKRPESLPKSGNSCRNYGYEISTGKYVTFFDSDDVMLPCFLSSRIDLFNENIDIVFATYTTVDENLKFLKQNTFKVEDVLIKEYLFWNFPILTHSALIRKEYLKDKNLFDFKIKRGQETDFYLNILPGLEKHQYLFVDKPSFLYRLHENSITGGTKKYNPSYISSLLSIRYKAIQVGNNLGNDEMVKNSYLHMILLLFQILKNKDFKNLFIFSSLLKNIDALSKKEKTEIIIVSQLLCVIGLTPKKLEKRWITFYS